MHFVNKKGGNMHDQRRNAAAVLGQVLPKRKASAVPNTDMIAPTRVQHHVPYTRERIHAARHADMGWHFRVSLQHSGISRPTKGARDCGSGLQRVASDIASQACCSH